MKIYDFITYKYYSVHDHQFDDQDPMHPVVSVSNKNDNVNSLLLTTPFLIVTFKYVHNHDLHLNICILCKVPYYFHSYLKMLGFSWHFLDL